MGIPVVIESPTEIGPRIGRYNFNEDPHHCFGHKSYQPEEGTLGWDTDTSPVVNGNFVHGVIKSQNPGKVRQ